MIYLIAQGYIRGSRHVRLGLPGVFAGLQLLGLIRLFAALWLSSDYSYMNLRGSGLGSEISETPLEKQVRETYSKLVSATTYWRLISEIVSFPFIAGRASFTGHFGSRRSGVSWGRLPEPVPRSSGTIPQDFHMIHHRTWCGGSCTLLCHFSVFWSIPSISFEARPNRPSFLVYTTRGTKSSRYSYLSWRLFVLCFHVSRWGFGQIA